MSPRRSPAASVRSFASLARWAAVAFGAAGSLTASASAATVTWDGGGGNLNWLTAANWSGDALPGAGDDVVIDAAGAVTIALAGSATVNSLSCADALTISAAGSLTVTSTAQVSGLVTLTNGKIVGGTWTLPAGLTATDTSINRLDGITLNGNATTTAANARIYLRNGLTLNGTLSLNGLNPRLIVENTMTIGGNGSLQLDGVSFNPVRLHIEGTSTLTLAPSILLEGGSAEIGSSLTVAGASTFVNQGTLRCDTANASFSLVGESVVNQGTIEVTAGTLGLAPTAGWANTGLMRALTTGSLVLDGPVTPTGLGDVRNVSGSVVLRSDLSLAGGTLTLNATTGVWTLDGCVLAGGTLAVVPGATPLLTGSNTVFDAMTVNGNLPMSTNQRLWIRNGFTLNGILSMTGTNGRFVVDGTQTIDGAATFQMDAGAFNPARLQVESTSTLTIAPSVLIEGGWAELGTSLQTPGVSTIINEGTIRCDTVNASFVIAGENFINNGVVEVTAGTLLISPSASWSNTSTMQSLGGTLRLEGSTTLASLAGITNGSGTVQNALNLDLTNQTWTITPATGPVTLDGGTLKNGTLTIQPGASVLLTGNNTIFDGMIVNGTIPISSNQRLLFRNNLTLNGVIAMSGTNPRLVADGTQALAGNATIDITTIAFNPARINIEAASVLTFASTVLIKGGWGEIGNQLQVAGISSFVNNGTIRCDASGASFALTGESLINNGTIEATAGTLTISPTTSWGNTGLVRALTTGEISIAGPTTLASLGDVRNVSGTVRLKSNLALGGQTFFFNATTGAWTFDGCTIAAGTLDLTSGVAPLFTSANTIFDGLTVNGAFTLGINQRFWINNGLVLNGSLTMNGTNPRLIVDGTQSLSGNATININAGGFNPARINVENASTFTIAPTVLIKGGWGELGNPLQSNGVSAIVNQGTIRCDTAGATFDIAGEQFTNSGSVEATAGSLNLSSTVGTTNTGLVRALTTGVVNVVGPTTLANLGDLRNVSGSVVLKSNLNLTAQTLALNATTGAWTFDGCTLTGGTLDLTAGVAPLFTSSNTIFDGIVVNGSFTLSTNQRFWMRNGLVLNGTLTMTGTNPRLVVDGTQTLSGSATLNLISTAFNPARVNIEGTSTLTLANTVLLKGGWAELGNALGTNGVSALVNQGTIRGEVSGSTFQITGESFTNDGTVESSGGGTLIIDTATNLNAAGVLSGGIWKAANATLRFGTITAGTPIKTLAAECVISGRTGKILDLAKLESIATNGILRLSDGAILTAVPATGTLVDNGFLFVSGVSKLNVTGGFTHAPTAVLTVATGAAGQIIVDASAALTLDGILQVSNGPGYTPIAGDQVIVTDGSSRNGTFATLTTCEASDLFYTPTQAVYVYGEDTGVFADLNGDGFVGPADLALLLGSWGQCSDLCCQADLDLSGDVGPADIALLLGSWG